MKGVAATKQAKGIDFYLSSGRYSRVSVLTCRGRTRATRVLTGVFLHFFFQLSAKFNEDKSTLKGLN